MVPYSPDSTRELVFFFFLNRSMGGSLCNVLIFWDNLIKTQQIYCSAPGVLSFAVMGGWLIRSMYNVRYGISAPDMLLFGETSFGKSREKMAERA